MYQLLSWALARSAGNRSRAWARLASFCEAGLFRLQYGVWTGSPVGMALVREHDQPGGGQLAHNAQIQATVRSCAGAGQRPYTHTISPSGARMTSCRFTPWRRCLPQ
jgi:hypothetical protein